MSNSNTNKSATTKALVAATGPIPEAKRGRPVGSGPWQAMAEQALANPGELFTYPEPVNPGTAQYLRKRYNLNITTRRTEASPKLVTMYIQAPAPVKAKRQRQPRPAVTPTSEVPTVQA